MGHWQHVPLCVLEGLRFGFLDFSCGHHKSETKTDFNCPPQLSGFSLRGKERFGHMSLSTVGTEEGGMVWQNSAPYRAPW